jgi:hypothetical protein
MYVTYIYHHSRFNPERVAEASQILLRDAHVWLKLLIYGIPNILQTWQVIIYINQIKCVVIFHKNNKNNNTLSSF